MCQIIIFITSTHQKLPFNIPHFWKTLAFWVRIPNEELTKNQLEKSFDIILSIS